MINRLMGVLSCLILINCAGTVSKVSEEYGATNFKNSKLAIIIMQGDITISNPEDVSKYLGEGSPSTVFCDFFSDQILNDAKNDGVFGNVFLEKDYIDTNFRNVNRSLTPDESISFLVPKRNALNSDSLPFILILDNLTIERKKTAGKSGSMNGNVMTGGSFGSDNLVLSGTYVLWDNISGKSVSFGKIDEKAGVIIAMTKNTWVDMAKNISYQIFIGKPYGKSMRSSE